MSFTQKIGTLTRISTTQVQLTGTTSIKLRGKQRVLTSPTLLTSVSGIGGIDTGAVAASTFYYVYAVSTGVVDGIIASLSDTSPTGYVSYKKVGAFSTNASSQVLKAYYFGEVVLETEVWHGIANNTLGAVASYTTVENTFNILMNVPTLSSSNVLVSAKKACVVSVYTSRGDTNNSSTIAIYKSGVLINYAASSINGNLTNVGGGATEITLLPTENIVIDYTGNTSNGGYLSFVAKSVATSLNWKD